MCLWAVVRVPQACLRAHSCGHPLVTLQNCQARILDNGGPDVGPRAFRPEQIFFTVWAFLLVASEEGSDVSCGPHAQALSDPRQRDGRLSPQARRDANLPRIAFAASLQVLSRPAQ